MPYVDPYSKEETISLYCKGPYNFPDAGEYGIIVKEEDDYLYYMNIGKLPDVRF